MFSDMFKSIRSGSGKYSIMVIILIIAVTVSFSSPFFVSTDQDVHAAAQTFKAKAKIAGSDLSESEFETWMDEQGFPSSYKSSLRTMHKKHPKWIFKADKTNMKWSTMYSKENDLGNNLVEVSEPEAWKMFNESTYSASSRKYKTFDASWNQASSRIMKYYLDPRNFINDTHIFQFLDQSDTASLQTTDSIKGIVNKYSYCFMNTNRSSYHYPKYILKAAKATGVNANALTAMIVLEQGWSGGSQLISGKYTKYNKKYYKIYNYFNVGAYTTAKMDKIHHGLWYAKGESKGKQTSYSRAWTSRYKAIKGGAQFYKENYISNDQNTFYKKKFNVMNGTSKVATHEYMTNISGADSEGRLLAMAYNDNSDSALVFNIPVYKNMPARAKKPSTKGNYNNILKSLKIDTKDCALSPKFTGFTTKYSVTVPSDTETVKITAKADSSLSTVTGAGTVTLSDQSTTVKIIVKASRGNTKTYYLTINK